MSAPTSYRLALSVSLIAVATLAFSPSAGNAEEASTDRGEGWTDAQIAEQAARLAGPDTVAVVHFEPAAAVGEPCAAGWFDRFEKRLAGETLDEYGVREAVVAIDLGAFGSTSIRAVVGMDPEYRRTPEAENELRALFSPLAQSVTFHERTLRLASEESHVSAEAKATLDAECLARQLSAVGPAPLRVVTVRPRSADDGASFVSSPMAAATSTSSEPCLALGFDYRTSTGTLRILRGDRPAIELSIDDESGRAIALRGFARMARVASDRMFPLETAAAPGADEYAEIELPPFGIPSAW